MNWARSILGAIGLATVAVVAHGADIGEVLDVRIGDGLAQLNQKMHRLEPYVCDASERSWHQTQGWSCEGYELDGVQAGGLRLRARFRMIEPLFTVGNVTLTATFATNAGASDAHALVAACDQLMQAMTRRFGAGNVSAMNKNAGSVRYVAFYDSAITNESGSLVCQERGLSGHAEVVVTIDPLSTAGEPRRVAGLSAFGHP